MAHWIKFEMATLDKPEVLRICRQVGLSREAVVGYLIRFWGWFGDNSVDGHVDAVEARDVDVVLSLPGFADALLGVKWLEYDPKLHRLTMPHFDRHNGESSKKRALKSERQARYREKSVDAPVDAPASLKVLPDKRRVDINNRKTSLAAEFSISPRVLKWSQDHGVLNLQAHFEHFVSCCKAKGYQYVDWDAALINAVRGDWAKVGKGEQRRVAI